MKPLLSEYLDKIIKQSKTVDSRGVMQVNRMIDIELEDIFIELNLKLNKDRSAKGQGIKTLTLEEVSKLWMGDPKDTPSVIRTLEEKLERQDPAYPPDSSPYETLKLNDIWSSDSHWVLLGDPGAGKTTILKYLAYEHARQCKRSENNCFIPLPVILRNFASEFDRNLQWKSSDALLNFLCGTVLEEVGFEASARKELRDCFEKVLKEGKAVLLLDGLDEQSDTAAKQRTCDAIEALLSRFPNNRCIVTSRIIGYDLAPLGSGFSTATLEPFDDDQMKLFFENWFKAIERSEDIVDDDATKNRALKKAAELIEQLSNNERVQRLAANPLLCSIIGLIFRQGGDTLPAQRGELYKLCIDTLIFNWEHHKTRKGMERVSLDKDETQAALEAMALYLHEKAIYTASRSALIEVVSSFLKDDLGYEQAQALFKAEKLLDLVRDVAGLLIGGDDAYAFFHLTFQEYLTARAITRKRRLIDHYLSRYLFKPRWREVIRLAAIHQGMKDEESGSDFIAAILRHPHQREAEMQYAFRIALQCATEARLELKTSDMLMGKWIDLYFRKPELTDLLNDIAVHRLRYMAGTLQPLITALQGEDDDVRIIVARTLGKLKALEAVAPLVAVLQDENIGVRMNAAKALGKIKSREAVAPLIATLWDKNEGVCRVAASALGEIKSSEAVAPLVAALRDESGGVRMNAADALGEIKSPEAVAPLIAVLWDENEDMRMIAASVLGEIKSSEAIAPLIVALRDENEGVRMNAANALGKIKSPEAVTPLIIALLDENEDMRMIAASVLGEIKSSKAIAHLVVALRDENEGVRMNAAKALGEIKSPEAVAPLIAALQDENEYVRMIAAYALGEITLPEAVVPLIAVLQDENKDVRVIAARALGKIKSSEAVTPLIVALREENKSVRINAAKALGEIKSPEAVAPLIAALQDENEYVRCSAAEALGEIKAPEAITFLLAALRDENEDVRDFAAEALGEIKAPETVAPLIVALRDENESVRWLAAGALRNFKTPEAVAPLITALRDGDEAVRWLAASMLGESKAPEVIAPLIAALRDENEDVRGAAAEALGEIKSLEAVAGLLAVMSNNTEENSVRSAAAKSIEQIDMGGEQ